jgi:hypothetical protein
MGKAVKKLSARAVATIAQPGRHSDGDGLYLNVTRSGARSWLFMWKKDGKRREMGLGSAGSVSLARARELARECRAQVAAGFDPIEARAAAAEIKPEKPNFGAIADSLIAAKESEWRNEKHRAQWRASLMEFAAPLRSRPIDEIDTAAVLAVLTPLWQYNILTRVHTSRCFNSALSLGHASQVSHFGLDYFCPKRNSAAACQYEAIGDTLYLRGEQNPPSKGASSGS